MLDIWIHFVLLIVTDVLGGILILALLSVRTHLLANRLLACALISTLLEQQLGWAIHSHLATADYGVYLRLPFSFRMLTVPLVYLYVCSLTQPNFRLRRATALHLVPFVASIAWYFLVRRFAPESWNELSEGFLWERHVRLSIVATLEIGYGLAAFRELNRYRTLARGVISSFDPLRLQWLYVINLGMLAVWLFDTTDLLTGPRILLFIYYPYLITTILFALAFFSLRTAAVISLVTDEVKISEDDAAHELKKSLLSETQLQRYSEQLRALLKEKALYTNSELRLADLAQELGLKPYRVSEVINRGLHSTFYDLVNQFRVERAKAMLLDPKFNSYNLLGVAQECGFHSKSVFNEVFKNNVGCTPSEFKKSTAAV